MKIKWCSYRIVEEKLVYYPEFKFLLFPFWQSCSGDMGVNLSFKKLCDAVHYINLISKSANVFDISRKIFELKQ